MLPLALQLDTHFQSLSLSVNDVVIVRLEHRQPPLFSATTMQIGVQQPE